jgi:hypothetical protein
MRLNMAWKRGFVRKPEIWVADFALSLGRGKRSVARHLGGWRFAGLSRLAQLFRCGSLTLLLLSQVLRYLIEHGGQRAEVMGTWSLMRPFPQNSLRN